MLSGLFNRCKIHFDPSVNSTNPVTIYVETQLTLRESELNLGGDPRAVRVFGNRKTITPSLFFDCRTGSEVVATVAAGPKDRVGIYTSSSLQGAIHCGSVSIGNLGFVIDIPSTLTYDPRLDEGPVETPTEWVVVQENNE